MVVSGVIDLTPLISRRFSLLDVVAGFQAAQDRNGLKVVLEPLAHSAARKERDSDEE
jgi:threonine dehydrogenase-like Zn-dependent dehydrogenase